MLKGDCSSVLIDIGRPSLAVGGTIAWVGDPGLHKLKKGAEELILRMHVVTALLRFMVETVGSAVSIHCCCVFPALMNCILEPRVPLPLKLRLSGCFSWAKTKDSGHSATPRAIHSIIACQGDWSANVRSQPLACPEEQWILQVPKVVWGFGNQLLLQSPHKEESHGYFLHLGLLTGDETGHLLCTSLGTCFLLYLVLCTTLRNTTRLFSGL